MPTKQNSGQSTSSGAEPPPATAAGLLRRLPGASIAKADRILANFRLSKFPEGAFPSNYVEPDKRDSALSQAERARQVHDFQKDKIEQHLHKLRTAEQRDPRATGGRIKGITVALPKAKVDKLLPSYDREKGTLELADLLALAERHMKGTEFHRKGDPTLNRLGFLKRIERLRQHLGLERPGQKKRGAK